MNDEQWKQLQHYSRNHFYGTLDALRAKKEKDRSALSKDQLAHGFGLILDPLDSRFDEIEVEHFKAELRAYMNGWLEAYEVKRLVPDERTWKELCSFQQQSLGARKMSLCQTASGRANRTGINPAPGIARAEALGQELERSSHAFMKLLHCEIEKRKNMKPNASDGAQIVNNLTIHGNATNVAMGQSATIHVSISNLIETIEAEIGSRLQDCQEKTELGEILETLRHSQDKPSFLERVNKFVGTAKNCGELVLLIPKWAQDLHNYAQAHFPH